MLRTTPLRRSTLDKRKGEKMKQPITPIERAKEDWIKGFIDAEILEIREDGIYVKEYL